MEYLDFELPIKELHDQLEKCMLIGEESKIDVSETCLQIEKKLKKRKKKYIVIYLHGKEYNCQDTLQDPIH